MSVCNVHPRKMTFPRSAIHAFFRYVTICEPALALQCQRVLAIPSKRATFGIARSDQFGASYTRTSPEKSSVTPRCEDSKLSFPPAYVVCGTLLQLQHLRVQAGQPQPLAIALCPIQCLLVARPAALPREFDLPESGALQADPQRPVGAHFLCRARFVVLGLTSEPVFREAARHPPRPAPPGRNSPRYR